MSNLLSTQITENTIPSDASKTAVKSENTGASEVRVANTTEQDVTPDIDGLNGDLTPSQEDKQSVTPNADGIINIDIEPIKKKKFCINGDLSNMLELNISDINIVQRLDKALKKLNSLQQDALTISNSMSEIDLGEDDGLEKLSNSLELVDNQMRELVDYIFNAPVSAACAKDGSMYDMFKGAFRYEHIIETLLKLYESNVKVEYSNMRSKLSKYTSKYTKKRR